VSISALGALKAASAAINAIKNKKSRDRILIVILTPIGVVGLLIAMIIYLLSMPFQVLGEFFSDEADIEAVVALQQEHGYLQYVSEDDPDLVAGTGLDYADVQFSDGGMDVVYYNQFDLRWAEAPYGNAGSTVASSGCGPTSLAMVVSTLTSRMIFPPEMARWAYTNGYLCQGSGSYHTLIPEGARAFGLAVEGCAATEPQRIADALTQGKLVIAIMSAGHFTRSGHFIVLRGMTSTGQAYVADSASRERSEQLWDLSLLCNEATKGADAAGPFWIIG
jgi:hypothetical protein